MIILIVGLPSARKSALAAQIAESIGATYIESKAVWPQLSRNLAATDDDAPEYSDRLSSVAHIAASRGTPVIVDYTCATKAARMAFGTVDYTIWVNTNDAHSKVWEDLEGLEYSLKINKGLSIEQEHDIVLDLLKKRP